MLCNVTHIARLRSSLLDKSKDFAQHLTPALLNNLLVVSCAILLKETVNLNKLKNHVGFLLDNRLTKTDSHYKRLTRFFNDKTALHKLWNRSAEAMAHHLDHRLYQRLGWPLTEPVSDPGRDELAVGQPPHPPTGIVSGLSGHQLTLVMA